MIAAIEGDFQASDLFTPAEKAAIKWAEVVTEKTYRGENPQAMPELKAHYSDAQIVEITMVSCTFNFWNRFTDSLQIDIEEAPVMDRFTKSATIDPADYVAFMCDCWWNKPGAAEAANAAE
ncbi:MAG: carboxymuconolactone decarboxylase family protein [Alphaproteobacteria bacterium]|nr:carboxymuconolactone decarboxylase family protein [Alphaproteobacteria bacterium]